MCGIAGAWGGTAQDAVFGMLGRLAHRGPDAEGLYRDPEGAGTLGHRRLSIIDVRGGNQPIGGSSPRASIAANGEIYNFQELRAGLGQHAFRTRSDTETALALYEEGVPDFVRQLDGMFAFLIADGDDLIAARDPIGIKPLYTGRNNGTTYFASEAKALIGLTDAIEEFPPGTIYHSERGFERYYTIPQPDPDAYLDEDDAIREVRATLERAVRKRLISDVPVGAFLSGGLDSSAVAALARRHVDELHTFAVGIEGSEDLAAARAVARHIDSVHHEYVFTASEVRALLPSILYHLESFDQDLVRSAVPTFLVSRLAAQHVKVVLTGEGADELFAGYTYYHDIHDPAALQQELRRSIGALHSMNLQRCDRMTMAHGLEARVPFLDTELIALSMRIDPAQKLRREGGRSVEKWILRRAVEDLLPHNIVWRDKAQFDEGSGSNTLLSSEASWWLSDSEAAAYRERTATARLRSTEEAVYHSLLSSEFADPGPLLDIVDRWTDDRQP
jgi:asparagine synthase (glutamine-hydrolysing)